MNCLVCALFGLKRVPQLRFLPDSYTKPCLYLFLKENFWIPVHFTIDENSRKVLRLWLHTLLPSPPSAPASWLLRVQKEETSECLWQERFDWPGLKHVTSRGKELHVAQRKDAPCCSAINQTDLGKNVAGWKDSSLPGAGNAKIQTEITGVSAFILRHWIRAKSV